MGNDEFGSFDKLFEGKGNAPKITDEKWHVTYDKILYVTCHFYHIKQWVKYYFLIFLLAAASISFILLT